MDAQQLYAHMESLANQIKAAETKYCEALDKLHQAKQRLFEKEAELYNAGKIKGRNEDFRNAELWPHTKNLHLEVASCEQKVDAAKIDLHYLQHRLETVQLITKLMAK